MTTKDFDGPKVYSVGGSIQSIQKVPGHFHVVYEEEILVVKSDYVSHFAIEGDDNE